MQRGALHAMAALIAVSAGSLASSAVAQPTPEALARAGPAVVRVVASRCSGGESRSGSGFVWGGAEQVVTALHVVAGCEVMQVHYQGVRVSTARIARTLRSADLALLVVEGPPSVTPLAASTRLPIGETVVVFGYGLDVATREERRLYVTSATNDTPLLSDAINAETRQQLRAIGAPALDTEVLRVDGNLLPGHSGAPVLDGSGRVVGVGSGGLQRGAVGVGWAIRARYLADLAAAPAVSSGRAPALATVAGSPGFATVNPDIAGRRVRCGELDFVLTRSGLSLGVLTVSSDDQFGFQQLAATTGLPWQTLDAIKFDVWTEARSGAGVAVRTGATLQPAGGACFAQWSNGLVTQMVAGMRLPDPRDRNWLGELQMKTNYFEDAWVREFSPYMVNDPRFSYGPPRTGSGGFMVNRKTYYGQRPGYLPHGTFETLLAKGTAAIGVVAITRHYPSQMSLPDPETYMAWVAAVFATHLSTVPP